MTVLAFGTYDVRSHPRVQVLLDGLRAHGHEVAELNEPLGFSTAERVRLLRQPWRLPALASRLAYCWARLATRRCQLRGDRRPSAVLVGYLGHFDVVLARLLFPRTRIVLDHLIFASATAVDRGVGRGLRVRALQALDRLALSAADVVVVDTEEHRELVPTRLRDRVVVIPVGAEARWFDAAARTPASHDMAPLSVIFFGLFTPLQGAPTIAQALRLLHDRGLTVRATLVGSGQDTDAVQAVVGGLPNVTWHAWVDGAELPALVAAHDVCLGIFGTTEKARRVVPNKVFQGAAAGCAVVTSDTGPQRRMFGDAAVFVRPGDAQALADALAELAADRGLLAKVRGRSSELAACAFTAHAVAAPLARAIAS